VASAELSAEGDHDEVIVRGDAVLGLERLDLLVAGRAVVYVEMEHSARRLWRDPRLKLVKAVTETGLHGGSVLVGEVEVTHDDERIARREAVLSPEGFELLFEISRGVFLQNEEPARLKDLLKAVEALS
jgi:hypothetical protein